MLIIDKAKTPTTSRRCFAKNEAAWLAKELTANSISFYCEPESDEHWLFVVNVEAGYVLDAMMHRYLPI